MNSLLVVSMLALLILTPVVSSAQLEFHNCPTQPLTTTICIPLEYDFYVIDLSGQYTASEIHFYINTGPGEIDNNGVYRFNPSPADINTDYFVEVIAYTYDNTAQVSCQFEVGVEEHPDEIIVTPGSCGDVHLVEAGHPAPTMYFITKEENSCMNLPLSLVSIEPEPIGSYHLGYDAVEERYSFSFYPSEYDGGKLFTATFLAYGGRDSLWCEIQYEPTWGHIDPPPEERPYVIEIESRINVMQGRMDTVDIFLKDGTIPIGGFDLLLGYDNRVLSFQSANPGSLPDECDWEYFTYRYGSLVPCPGTCPSGMVRVVAIAETNNGPNHPSCNLPAELPATLASLQFYVTNDRTVEGTVHDLAFFWNDCGDNSFSNKDGNRLILASKISQPDYFNDHIISYEDVLDTTLSFPTYYGGGPCDTGTKIPERLIEFRNGLFKIIGPDVIEPYGDLNFNTIAYEIADYVLYTNYFVYGIGVFDVNTEVQIIASDVNRDEITLSIADLVYLNRIIVGDALPYAKLRHDFHEAYFSLYNDDVHVDTDTPLGAVFLVVRGYHVPELYQSIDMLYAYDDKSDVTRILLFNMNGGEISTGRLLGDIDNAVLYVEAASIRGERMRLLNQLPFDNNSLGPGLPGNFYLSQNYPNPFNITTKIHFLLSQQAEVTFEIINMLGQVIYKHTDTYAAGSSEFEWNGTNNSGDEVASGVYYYRATAGDDTQLRKMVLMK